jgi:hypothetical protein
MSSYYREGRKAYFTNGDRPNNPYQPGSDAYNEFERGWTQSVKRSGYEPLFKPKPLFSPYQLPNSVIKKKVKSEVATALEERYRRLKE